MYILSFPVRSFFVFHVLTALFFIHETRAAVVDTSPGDHITGECISVSNGYLKWKTAFSNNIAIPLTEVSHLDKTPEPWDLEMQDGFIIRARWGIENSAVVIDSSVFGTLRCPPAALKSATLAVQARGLDTQPPAQSQTAADTSKMTSDAGSASSDNNQPPTSSLQNLLRDSTILLHPSEWSLGTEVRYTHDRALYSANDARQIGAFINLQRGMTSRWELGALLPSTITQIKTSTSTSNSSATTSVTTTSHNQYRVGDPEIQSSVLLLSEEFHSPEVVAVSGLTVPVNSANNNGLFRGRFGLEFLKTSDPCALIAGIGYQRDFNGWESSPYQSVYYVTYHLGTAIGLNDELAIGIDAEGHYQSATRYKSGGVLSLSSEPVFVRFWFDYRLSAFCFVEPSLLLPANDDAHATSLGLTYVQRF